MQLYTITGNEAATAALDELYDAVIQRFGASSAEALKVSQKFAAAWRVCTIKLLVTSLPAEYADSKCATEIECQEW